MVQASLTMEGHQLKYFRAPICVLCLAWLAQFPFLYGNSAQLACKPSDIPPKLVDRLYQRHSKTDRVREMLRRKVQMGGPFDDVRIRELVSDEYTHRLPTRGVRDQAYAGDCWIMAMLNVVRHQTSLAAGLADMNLSRTYVKFWSVFEHSNRFLEELIASRYETVQGAHQIFSGGVKEGGFFEWGVYLVRKYGLVSYEAMPDNFASVNSGHLMDRVNQVAKRHGARILAAKRRYAERPKLRKLKEAALTEIWRVLVSELGVPPREFDYRRTQIREAISVDEEELVVFRSQVRDIDPRVVRRVTPHTFAREEVAFDPTQYVVLGHFPNHPMNRKIRVTDHKIAAYASGLKFLNVPMEVMMQAAIDSILEVRPVWIGLDYSHGVDQWHGVIDPKIMIDDHIGPRTRNTAPPLSRADAIRANLSQLEHAVMIMGFDAPLMLNQNMRKVTPRHVKRFLLENTHGARANDNGFLHMSKEGFESNVFQVVVHKNLLPPGVRALLRTRAHRVQWASEPE